jgi:hypothetical protein
VREGNKKVKGPASSVHQRESLIGKVRRGKGREGSQFRFLCLPGREIDDLKRGASVYNGLKPVALPFLPLLV